jgi:hypothetical protein
MAAPQVCVETYRGIEIVWAKGRDDSGGMQVLLQCTVLGETLDDDWIHGLRKQIDAVLGPRYCGPADQ